MVSSQESAESANTAPLTPEDRHRAALQEGSGWSTHRADVALSGYDPDRTPPRPLADRPEHPHHDHRGGRSYPEPPENALDGNWQIDTTQLTLEQMIEKQRGMALARGALLAIEGTKMKGMAIPEQHHAIARRLAREARKRR